LYPSLLFLYCTDEKIPDHHGHGLEDRLTINNLVLKAPIIHEVKLGSIGCDLYSPFLVRDGHGIIFIGKGERSRKDSPLFH